MTRKVNGDDTDDYKVASQALHQVSQPGARAVYHASRPLHLVPLGTPRAVNPLVARSNDHYDEEEAEKKNC